MFFENPIKVKIKINYKNRCAPKTRQSGKKEREEQDGTTKLQASENSRCRTIEGMGKEAERRTERWRKGAKEKKRDKDS